MQKETLSLLKREKLNPNSITFRIRTFVMKDLRFAGKKRKSQKGAYKERRGVGSKQV